MRLADITKGALYVVKISEDCDRLTRDLAAYGEVHATVEEIGLHYTVTTYSGSRIRGDRGYRHEHQSARADGVRVSWDSQEVTSRIKAGAIEHVPSGRGIVPASSVVMAVDS